MSIGTIEIHPIDMVSAYGAIANGGAADAAPTILEVRDRDGKVVWPAPDAKPSKGKRVASPQASYIMTDILAGNTDREVNPYWGEWAIHDGIGGRTGPAAYKTGTTSDNSDVHAYGYLAPPKDKKAPALVVGRVDGQLEQRPQPRLPLARLVGAAVVGDPVRGEQGPADRAVQGLEAERPGERQRRRLHAASSPGRSPPRPFSELFIKGTAPSKSDNLHVVADIDAATGLRWQDGCAGPREARAFLDLRKAEPDFPQWRSATQSWQSRARGGPGSEAPTYFYVGGFRPFGSSWGGRFVPGALCPIAPVGPPPCVSTDPLLAVSNGAGGGDERADAVAATDQDEEALARSAHPRVRIVTPSPPSWRSPGRWVFTSGCPVACPRTASRSAPVPSPWMIVALSRPARAASSR